MIYKKIIMGFRSFSYSRFSLLRRTLSSDKVITVEKRDSITLIGINDPSTRNCLTSSSINQLSSALDNFEKDSESNVVVLHGEGGNFCSGFNVNEVNNNGYEYMVEISKRLRQMPLSGKPSICAMNGFSVAEGFELALACDLRVIEDTAAIGFLGRRFGCPQGLNGGSRLASLVGLSRALDLTLTGRIINGTMANDFGLAARYVSTGCALGQALHLAAEIKKFPQNAAIYDKLQMQNAVLPDSDEDRLKNEGSLKRIRSKLVEDIKNGTQMFLNGESRKGKMYRTHSKSIKSWEKDDEKILQWNLKSGAFKSQ